MNSEKIMEKGEKWKPDILEMKLKNLYRTRGEDRGIFLPIFILRTQNFQGTIRWNVTFATIFFNKNFVQSYLGKRDNERFRKRTCHGENF